MYKFACLIACWLAEGEMLNISKISKEIASSTGVFMGREWSGEWQSNSFLHKSILQDSSSPAHTHM